MDASKSRAKIVLQKWCKEMILCMMCQRKINVAYNELCYHCYRRVSSSFSSSIEGRNAGK
jgi:hypothetical protein